MRPSPSPENPPSPAGGVISRRRLVRLAGGAAAGLVLASCSSDSGPAVTGTAPSTGSSTPAATFTSVAPTTTTTTSSSSGRPLLSIPQRLDGSVFDLEMSIGEREFLAGLSTPTKGYNGDFLGPTLFLRSGSDVALNVTNNLGITTTTH